jgi:hypothetical protein
MTDDGNDVTRLTDNDDADDREPDWGTNTSPPGADNGDDDDDDKNEHDERKKHHGDNGEKKH